MIEDKSELADVLSQAVAICAGKLTSDLDEDAQSSASPGKESSNNSDDVATTAERTKKKDKKQTSSKKSSDLTSDNKKKEEGEGGKTADKQAAVKKRTWKKPKDKPKRPLSAYNLFFQSEREKIILDLAPELLNNGGGNGAANPPKRRRRHRKSHGKIGFAALARNIAQKWKNLDDEAKSPFEAEAEKEKVRYKKELDVWKKAQEELKKKAVAEVKAQKENGGEDTQKETNDECATQQGKTVNKKENQEDSEIDRDHQGEVEKFAKKKQTPAQKKRDASNDDADRELKSIGDSPADKEKKSSVRKRSNPKSESKSKKKSVKREYEGIGLHDEQVISSYNMNAFVPPVAGTVDECIAQTQKTIERAMELLQQSSCVVPSFNPIVGNNSIFNWNENYSTTSSSCIKQGVNNQSIASCSDSRCFKKVRFEESPGSFTTVPRFDIKNEHDNKSSTKNTSSTQKPTDNCHADFTPSMAQTQRSTTTMQTTQYQFHFPNGDRVLQQLPYQYLDLDPTLDKGEFADFLWSFASKLE